MKVSQMKIKVLPDEGVLVLGGPNLYNIAKILEYSCVDIQGFGSLGIYGYDAAFCGVVVFHAVHAFGDCLISKVSGLCTKSRVVDAAGGKCAIADEGISAGIVWDACIGQILEDSQLSCHDDIVGRSEDSVYFVSNQGGGSGNYFVVGICSLLGVGDAFFV